MGLLRKTREINKVSNTEAEKTEHGLILTKRHIIEIVNALGTSVVNQGDMLSDPKMRKDIIGDDKEEIKFAEEWLDMANDLFEWFKKVHVLVGHEEIPQSEPVLKCILLKDNIKNYYNIKYEIEKKKGVAVRKEVDFK